MWWKKAVESHCDVLIIGKLVLSCGIDSILYSKSTMQSKGTQEHEAKKWKKSLKKAEKANSPIKCYNHSTLYSYTSFTSNYFS